MKNFSTVQAELKIQGDGFDPQDITNKLGIIPNSTTKKGDLLKTNKPCEFSFWYFNTEEQIEYDDVDQYRYKLGPLSEYGLEVQMKKIIDLLKPKKDILISLMEKYKLRYIFEGIVVANNGYCPSISLDVETMKFMVEINAEFDVDLYANPYEIEDDDDEEDEEED